MISKNYLFRSFYSYPIISDNYPLSVVVGLRKTGRKEERKKTAEKKSQS